MTSLLWLPLYIPLLSGFVTAHSFAADDPPLEVCLNHDVQPAARVAACRTAAEAGDAAAQFSVGVRYAEGEGVPRDYMAAVAWYRRAAEQGQATAQGMLGAMYARGRGVAQDYTVAYKWLTLASVRGDESPVQARDALARLMTRAQVADAQRLAREWVEAHRAGAE